jgi:ABC transporter substrate binding protein (PQQ-dependent alcohol dehydrogenase system)
MEVAGQHGNPFRQRIQVMYALISSLLALLGLAAGPAPVFAADVKEVRIAYVHTPERGRITLSVLDQPPPDLGLAGVKVGINDNNTTGRFLKQSFLLEDVPLKSGEDPVPVIERLAASSTHFIVTDLPAADLLKLADAARGKEMLMFNAGALEDSLRERDCRANVIHTAPTYAMLADGLGQYLVWKQWRNWFLVTGSHPEDKLWGDALRRSAERFGAKIVAEKEFADTGGARQSDTGHAQVQRQMPVFTQDAPDHDVLIAADRSEVFGTYLPYRTWLPRPVAGSAGLMPSSWHPSFEGWGAAQIQNRFEKAARRRMLSEDMQAWTAVRMIGEAATRTQSVALKDIEAYIKAPEFSIAAFKGQKVTLRDWNLQLRQPVLLGDGRSVVSVSPQEGFLHEFSELDTLGIDRPETGCKLK